MLAEVIAEVQERVKELSPEKLAAIRRAQQGCCNKSHGICAFLPPFSCLALLLG
jgi:hypothetical protein